MTPVIPLRQQLRASIDLLDTGAAIRDAGTALQSAGSTIMLLQAPPSQHIINEMTSVAECLASVIRQLGRYIEC